MNFLAREVATAVAMAGVTSPIMELAKTMPMGPMITSAPRVVTRMAFSPVAPRLALAFIICAVAMALVPRAKTSISSPNSSFIRRMIRLPIPPP